MIILKSIPLRTPFLFGDDYDSTAKALEYRATECFGEGSDEEIKDLVESLKHFGQKRIQSLMHEHYNLHLETPIEREVLLEKINYLLNEKEFVEEAGARQNIIFLDPQSKQELKVKVSEIPSISLDNIELDFSKPALVEGLLDIGAMSLLYGAPNLGKSFFAIELAFAVASGQPFFGKAVTSGLVLYVATEGGESAKVRFIAAREKKNLTGKNIPLELITKNLDFYNSNLDANSLLALIDKKVLQFKRKPALIIIDTLARVMSGGNENAADDMGLVIKRADEIREVTGAHILIVHHAGKNGDQGPRGSSALTGAVDTSLEVTKGHVTVKKQRDMEFAKPMYFEIVKSVVQDKAGNLKDSAVLVEGQSIGLSGKQKPLSQYGNKGLSSLLKVIERYSPNKSEDLSTDSMFEGNSSPVGMKEWQDQFAKDHYPKKSYSTYTSAFSRARKDLVEKGRISVDEDKVTLQ